MPTTEETGLATIDAPILPMNVEAAISEWHAYQELTKRLLDNSDYQSIGPKSFKKKSAWRKYAKAFNLSCEIAEKHVERDERGDIVYADFVVRATAPSGRYTEGWASCSRSERQFSHNQDIAATAQTRAENRAISDLIGAGEVSAEEALDEKRRAPSRPPASKPPSPAPTATSASTASVMACAHLSVDDVQRFEALAQERGSETSVCQCCKGAIAPSGAERCKKCAPAVEEMQLD